MITFGLSGILFSLSCFLIAYGGETRTWTSTDGRSLKAEFVSANDKNVTLRRSSDGRRFTLPFNKISEADQQWVAKALGQKVADFSGELSKMIEGSPVPALAAAVVRDGKIVALGASGVRKAGDKTAVTVNDKFHLGSCTKSMTAVLAALMVEAGHLSWETTVSEVFPKVEIHEGYRGSTLAQLLTNTAGIPGEIAPKLWSELWKGEGSAAEQRMTLVRGILANAPGYPPGTKNVYSNAGFAIAGAMMEKKAGLPFEKLMESRLFEHLGMTSAGFRAPATNGKIDQPYGHYLRGGKALPVDSEPSGDNPRAIAPGGGVHCSVSDFAKYALFHLHKEGGGLIGMDNMTRLHTPVGGHGYAMGWAVTKRDWGGGTVLTHTGTNTMFYAVIWLAPKRDFAVVAMGNLGGKEAFQKCDEAVGALIEKYLHTEVKK